MRHQLLWKNTDVCKLCLALISYAATTLSFYLPFSLLTHAHTRKAGSTGFSLQPNIFVQTTQSSPFFLKSAMKDLNLLPLSFSLSLPLFLSASLSPTQTHIHTH